MYKLTLGISLTLTILLIFLVQIKAQNNMQDKSVKNEFYKNENLETLYKGKFVGETSTDNQDFFHFQFDGVLKGKIRFLNIYFETNDDKLGMKKVIFSETKIAAKGSTAYLLFKLADQSSFDLSYKLQNGQFVNSNDDKYDFSKLPQSPNIFFEKAFAETEQLNDEVFIISMVGNKHSEWFTVELIAWFKNDEGNYYPERYKTSIDGSGDLFKAISNN